MNRIARITTALSIAVLLLAGAASAQYNDQKITATIPFEFVVGKSILPAGQYVFLRTGANLLLVRNAQQHDVATVVTGSVQATEPPTNTKLKFATIDGSHVLVQVWHEHEAIGSELYRADSALQQAKYPAMHGTIAGRR